MARLLVLLLVVCGLLGCASEPYVSVADWTLECAGCTTSAVHLPANVDRRLAQGVTQYTLRTEVPLPSDLRGRELTLTLPVVYARGTLRIADEDVEPLDRSLLDRVRPTDAQLVFRIPARLTDRERLQLALTMDRPDAFLSGLFGEPPRLAAGPYGEIDSRFARAANGASCLAVLVLASCIAAAYLVLFLLDRRRAADGWFALIAAGVALWHACVCGLTQLLDTRDILHVPVFATGVICVGAPFFVHAHFRHDRPPRLLVAALVVLGIGAFALAWRPVPGPWREYALQILIIATVAYQLWFLGRSVRARDQRSDALWMLASWVLVGGVGVVNPVGQLQVTPASWLVFVLVHAALLVRAHARSLRTLNAELATRVSLLEQSNREVATLNDELRRQVGDRSARLVETLANVGRLSIHAHVLTPGQLVGDRYRVKRRLGEGAMGTVYEVERTTDGKRLAMKTLSHARSGAELARLAREAEVATKVVHPNVVGIVDVDVSQAGMLYVVMELVEGPPLSALTSRYGDPGWARGVLAQVASGLSALHDVGVVHRDLKPANVLLDQRDGATARAKIADFGIARLGDDTEADTHRDRRIDAEAETVQAALLAVGTSDPSLTATGVALGTPLYMAPELVHGSRDARPSSDMWSFGVMAYELATGRLPFEVPPVQEIVSTGRWKDAPVDTATLPAPMGTIVSRCLEADPARRMTAREVAEALAG
ncbi:MAG TPA: protein kinase [Polyangiaceae bacterium]